MPLSADLTHRFFYWLLLQGSQNLTDILIRYMDYFYEHAYSSITGTQQSREDKPIKGFLCHRNIRVHKCCWVALFFLFTRLILDIMLRFISLEVLNLDLCFHIRSQWCWNRVKQPPIPAYLLQSLLSATKRNESSFCSWCGWKNKLQEKHVSGRERDQATKGDIAVGHSCNLRA